MAEIAAFRGVRYDRRRVAAQDVVCPPYDVISPAQAEAFRARSATNAIHIDLPQPDGAHRDRYEAAAALLRDWLAGGVVQRDPKPSLYVLEQTFRGPDGWERTRRGFVALLRLEELAARVVLPHEMTHAGPKEDRLRLLRDARRPQPDLLALPRPDQPRGGCSGRGCAGGGGAAAGAARDRDRRRGHRTPLHARQRAGDRRGGAAAGRQAPLHRRRAPSLRDGTVLPRRAPRRGRPQRRLRDGLSVQHGRPRPRRLPYPPTAQRRAGAPPPTSCSRASLRRSPCTPSAPRVRRAAR